MKMYLVQERPVDAPARREMPKTTPPGKANISEMKCCCKEIRSDLVDENLREKSLQRKRFQRGPS